MHYLFLRLQNSRISSIASSITPAVISSAGRKRIEFSPERRVKTPRSKKPCQNSSRVFGSGKSKARNNPRPRAAEISPEGVRDSTYVIGQENMRLPSRRSPQDVLLR